MVQKSLLSMDLDSSKAVQLRIIVTRSPVLMCAVGIRQDQSSISHQDLETWKVTKSKDSEEEVVNKFRLKLIGEVVF